MNDFSVLIKLVQEGDNSKAVAEADRLISRGIPSKVLIEMGLVPALQELKSKCTIENFQLLEVLLSSRAMTEVIDQVIARDLQQSMDGILDSCNREFSNKKGSCVLVIGTIQGDVHDLGKHLVSTLSSLSGIKVIDLGKDVPPENFVNTAIKENADIIGVSTLMTVCLPAINEIRSLAQKKQFTPCIVAGGAGAHQAEPEYLDVDYVAFDAFEGLEYFLKFDSGKLK
ncbi:MAG: hypothetical protein GY777_17805 [Candidatus Brocadiaceae bacterium]|nr:hypothetical protein [Candidatus Brocadiaceae bacterium]